MQGKYESQPPGAAEFGDLALIRHTGIQPQALFTRRNMQPRLLGIQQGMQSAELLTNSSIQLILLRTQPRIQPQVRLVIQTYSPKCSIATQRIAHTDR